MRNEPAVSARAETLSRLTVPTLSKGNTLRYTCDPEGLRVEPDLWCEVADHSRVVSRSSGFEVLLAVLTGVTSDAHAG
jgi:hypothetical protein